MGGAVEGGSLEGVAGVLWWGGGSWGGIRRQLPCEGTAFPIVHPGSSDVNNKRCSTNL